MIRLRSLILKTHARALHHGKTSMCGHPTDDDTSERTDSRFRPDSLGRVFGTIFIASVGSFVLSSISLAALSWWLSENEPEFSLSDPPVLAILGSWVGVWASLLAYSTWSFWQLRRMTIERSRPRSRNPLVRGYQLLSLVSADVDELTEYEKRLQLTVQSFILGTITLVGTMTLFVTGQGRGVSTPDSVKLV